MIINGPLKSKQEFVIRLGRIVSLYGAIYSSLFYWAGFPVTALIFTVATIVLYPLMLQFFKRDWSTLARFALIAQGLIYIYTASVTIKPDILIEYYYIPQMLVSLLVFDSKQKKEVLIGILFPFIVWLFAVNQILPLPFIVYHNTDYQIYFQRINFIGAFFITAFFLNHYRQYLVNLGEARNAELEKFKNLSQHLNNSQRIAKTGSWQYNFKTDNLIWSDEVYSIFEVTREDFFPTMELFDQYVHPEDFPAVTKAFRNAIKTKGHYEIVHRILLKDDRVKFLREQCEIIYDEAGEAEVAMGTTQDITETKLNDEFVHYSSKMAAVGEMAGSIAHEINNPLTVISGRTNLLLRKMDRGDTLDKKDLHSILNHADRISKIVRSLKNISRNDEADPMQVVPVQKIFEDVYELSAECFRTSEVQLHFETSSDVKILCHSSEMSQVLLNLINNSFDAVQPLDERWVRVHTSHEEEVHKILVTDSGNGIPKQISQKLMYPFFTTKEQGKGTGLGLLMSKRIVEKHRGRLYYDEQSPNTRFVIELPALRS